MGSWNRSRHVRGHRDRRPSRPPLPPPDYGQEHCSVPLWEREFCCQAGNISWQKFCENKGYTEIYMDIKQWDDSGALENFQNAKARFRAHYHGQPSDIPLPEPDMYIDKVDQNCKVDPGLVVDLDEVGLPFESDNNSAATTEADKKPASQNHPGNWDMCLEKPDEVNNWGPEVISGPEAAWGELKHEPTGWQWDEGWQWGDGWQWDDAPANRSWRSSSNNYYSSNTRNDFQHGGSSSRYHQGRSNMSGRRRGSGGRFQRGNSGERNQAGEGWQWPDHREGYQRSGRQDHRGRNSQWRPVHNRNPRQNGQGPDSGF